MKKIKLVFLLCMLSVTQLLHAELNRANSFLSESNFAANVPSFENDDFQRNKYGDLPSAPVFLNVVAETSASYSSFGKSKVPFPKPIRSKTKIIFNSSFLPIFIFGRYCSVLVQIYLKNACFRI